MAVSVLIEQLFYPCRIKGKPRAGRKAEEKHTEGVSEVANFNDALSHHFREY